MNQILVIGSVAFDTICTPLGKCSNVLGGSSVYFSISASFFSKVNLVAIVGEDFPKKHINLLKSFNVDVKGLEIKKGKTFRWSGSYMEDLNCAKTIETQLNVFSEFKPNIPKEYKNSKYLFLANIDPDLQLHLLKNSKYAKFTASDSMNYWIDTKKPILKKVIKNVDCMFFNEEEAKSFSGEDNIIKAGRYILSLGPKYTIIKRGEYGAMLFTKKGVLGILPAYPTEKVKDPTGAGDTFGGGFIGYLAKVNKLNDNTLKQALKYATIMSSFTVEDFSVNRLLKLRDREIEKRAKNIAKLLYC